MGLGVTKRVVARVHVANLGGVLLNSLTPITAASSLASKNIYRWTGVQALYIVTALTVGTIVVVRRTRSDDPADALGLPRFCAAVALSTWFGGAILNAVLASVSGGSDRDVAAVVIRNLLMGALCGSISFLLVERAMTPVYGETFTREGIVRTGLSLRTRLVVAWLTGSATPLVLFGSVLFGQSAADRAQLASYAWIYVLLGLITGAAMTLTVSESIANPIEGLRRAINEVGAGDLDTHVAVDDGTEIGQLQAGFNRMVDGLRERDRLHDLFGRHVGAEVAQAALGRETSSLGGEQCEATALFVDITASTSLGERLAPTDVVALLNEFFAEVVACVTREGGWVNKFEGDAALCVFGPPVGHDDHADRALRAAARMRDGLRSLKQRLPELDAGIGVATGVVVAGNVGAQDRFEFTVIGDPVNTAARVSELAKGAPGRAITTKQTVAAANGAATGWSPIGPVTLRNRSDVTELYELD